MSHDPMCPSLGIGVLPVADLCRCSLIVRVRSDERSKTLDAARDAVDAVPPIDQRVDDNGLVSLVYDKGEALAAIDALRGER